MIQISAAKYSLSNIKLAQGTKIIKSDKFTAFTRLFLRLKLDLIAIFQDNTRSVLILGVYIERI